jgi:hypothetical protein
VFAIARIKNTIIGFSNFISITLVDFPFNPKAAEKKAGDVLDIRSHQ